MTPRHSHEEKCAAFGRLLDILDELRVKCPWDRKQTNDSLRPNTIEETYELCEALTNNDTEAIKKELGDVLLHIAFYAKIGEEKGLYDMADICEALCQKLIYRHPHVFGTTHVNSSGEVEQNWEALKLKEKDGNKTVLAGVPTALPALIKAYRIQEKACNIGFDWEKREQVWDKVKEEIGEFENELASLEKEKAEQEFGDLLFSLINAARLYKINPENALERTNQKFIRRFNYVEMSARQQEKNLREMTLSEMDALWNEAKEKDYSPFGRRNSAHTTAVATATFNDSEVGRPSG
ncbi:MAG: nucleoside triphosphate pyrophosphohydrolase [Porphyromonadaceae bacterium]|nr:nucleoside triphosphate pyrophosphohydrolase [Porphyromonadaceae bacterium]